jgi:putative hydrolase of HD superfamily
MDEVNHALETIEIFNKFKQVERLSLVAKNGRRESDADHSWQLAMSVWLLSNNYEKKIDLDKAIKMALIHDLVEIYAGDVYAMSTTVTKQEKHENELKAMSRIIKEFPEIFGSEIKAIWDEYEERQSEESKFVWAIDKILPMIQYKLTEGDMSDGLGQDTELGKKYDEKTEEISAFFFQLRQKSK